ncbi:hypothetical protein C0Q70_18941 [Pomacea canaliculata]|uniref:Uncharacterized protein n=1 Tax=Pomacea canaliculata TaxID=400727 RepID=A0A2T7NHX9_POMCA|nr:hypothetical protein C0Q70_18941 [Pomacea canaliculata]
MSRDCYDNLLTRVETDETITYKSQTTGNIQRLPPSRTASHTDSSAVVQRVLTGPNGPKKASPATSPALPSRKEELDH